MFGHGCVKVFFFVCAYLKFGLTLFWTLSLSVFLPASETELAFFKMSDYERYKANPQTVW